MRNLKKQKLKIITLIVVFIISLFTLLEEGYKKDIKVLDHIDTQPQLISKKAKVLSVYDGDTITIAWFSQPNKKIKVRVKDLDCFEMESQFDPAIKRAYKQAKHFGISIQEVYKRGKEARDLLRKMIQQSHNEVVLAYNKNKSRDYYKRLLAYVFVNGTNINQPLIESKTCFKYIRNL